MNRLDYSLENNEPCHPIKTFQKPKQCNFFPPFGNTRSNKRWWFSHVNYQTTLHILHGTLNLLMCSFFGMISNRALCILLALNCNDEMYFLRDVQQYCIGTDLMWCYLMVFFLLLFFFFIPFYCRFKTLSINFTHYNGESGLFVCVSLKLELTQTHRVAPVLCIHPLLIPSSFSGLDLQVALTVTNLIMISNYKVGAIHIFWSDEFENIIYASGSSSHRCSPHLVRRTVVHGYWACPVSVSVQTLVPAPPGLVVPGNGYPAALLPFPGHFLCFQGKKQKQKTLKSHQDFLQPKCQATLSPKNSVSVLHLSPCLFVHFSRFGGRCKNWPPGKFIFQTNRRQHITKVTANCC